MIKNEKQYRITNAQARRFEAALAESQLRELQEQIDAYELLHVGKSKELVLEAVEDLPKTLIRARIASGMTQQAQRYEATEYESASFTRICKVVQALGLRMPKPTRLIRG